jgi:hypothetical protein
MGFPTPSLKIRGGSGEMAETPFFLNPLAYFCCLYFQSPRPDMPYLRCYFASKKASPKFLLHANTMAKPNLQNNLTPEIFVPILGMYFQRVKDDPHFYGGYA